MKKRNVILAALCLTGAVLLTGCSGKNNNKENGTEVAEDKIVGTEGALNDVETEETEETEEGTDAAIEFDEAALSGSVDVPDYKASEFVTLGEYKGLQVQYPTPEVTEEDLQWHIEELQDEHTEYIEITDRTSQTGDCINIDFVGTINGEEFEEGSAEGYDVIIGDGEFLEEFENNLVGKKAGDEFTFSVTYPDDYYDEAVAGQQAEFSVTVNTLTQVVVPEYNDAFVAQVSDYATVAEYETYANELLMQEAEASSRVEAEENALLLVKEQAQISDGYPQELYNSCYQETYASYQSYAEMFGMEFDEFLSDFMAMTAADMEQEVKDYMNEILVVKAIAEQEGIEIADYTTEATALAAEYEYETLEEFETDYGKTYIENELIRNKVTDILFENAELQEVSSDEYYGTDEEEEVE